MLVQIVAIRDDMRWWRPYLEERCLRICFLLHHDLEQCCVETFHHLLYGAVGLSKVLFVKLLEVLLVDSSDDSLHTDIGDRLLYLVRLLAILLRLLKFHDIESGGGEINGAGHCRFH